MKIRCDTCVHYHVSVCRRRAPVILQLPPDWTPETKGYWPGVDAAGRCGEWAQIPVRQAGPGEFDVELLPNGFAWPKGQP